MSPCCSPTFPHVAPNRARTRRILFAVAVSASVHALLMNGGAVDPASRRAAHAVHPALSVTLSDARPSFPEQGLQAPEAVETHAPARRRREYAMAKEPLALAPAERPADRSLPQLPHALAEAPSKVSETAAHSFDTTYYSIRQLDIYPVPAEPLRLGNLAHAVPGDGLARAVVELHISETGGVDAAKVIHAHPAGYYEGELTKTFLAARFTPAIRDGRAVRSRVLVRIE